MSGRIAKRHTVTGTLVALSALHIGADADGVMVDMLQAIDGLGRIHIPGTALTGAVRTALGARGEKNIDWWGDASANGTASRITICDAPAIGSEIGLEDRTHVSIDPRTRTAVTAHLYTQSVVPAGTRFDFRMTVESPGPSDGPDDDAVARIKEIIGLLAGPGLQVGHGSTTGLGLVGLREHSHVVVDLTNRAGLRAAVLGDNAAQRAEVPVDGCSQDTPRPWELRISVPWRPTGPIMSKVSVDGGVVTAYPLTTQGADGKVHLLLPGSEIKGILRAHASYILRTVREHCEIGADFHDWMSDVRLKEVLTAFGTPGTRKPQTSRRGAGSDDETSDMVGAARGVIGVNDITTARGFDRGQWNAILMPRSGAGDENDVVEAVAALNASLSGTGLRLDLVTRNAIDRWTGGVAAGALYSAIEPYAAQESVWHPIVMTVDMKRLWLTDGNQYGDLTTAVLTLLLFVLRDIVDGYVPLGFGTSRGLGAIEVAPERVTFALGELALDAGGLPSRIADRGDLAGVLADSELVKELNEAWMNSGAQPERPSGAAVDHE